jgi:hypothetical protein
VEYYKEHLTDEIISAESTIEKKRSTDAINRNINALKSLFNYLTTETETRKTENATFIVMSLARSRPIRKKKQQTGGLQPLVQSSCPKLKIFWNFSETNM